MEKPNETNNYSRFNVVDDYSDHHYVKKVVENSFTNCSSFAYKRIMKEWKLLEKSLPESITVHVYKKRIDLMRAVIVGSACTPYHDALFFFDINFPNKYPHEPPNVFYHSFGYQLNPNLHRSGKVSLGLHNPTDATCLAKKDKDYPWSPSCTVLDLLLSIQAIVLNEKPYPDHNEPGSNGSLSQTFRSSQLARSYNENVFLMSRRTMLCLISKPPKGFERFVSQYFRDHGKSILDACKAYAYGLIKIGRYYNQGDSSPNVEINVSYEFKASMITLYPQLFRAFSRIGARLGDCDKDLRMAKHEPDLLKSPPKAPSRFLWIKTKIIGNLKKIFGIKKKE